MKVVAIVFDWAGTMVDFGCMAPVAALRAAFAGHGVALSAAQVRRDMGKAKRDHVRALLADPEIRQLWATATRALPDQGDEDHLMAALEPLMATMAKDHAALIPGAADLVALLGRRSVKIGSCTGYSRAMMAGILPLAAAGGYAPEAVVCSDDTPLGRPSPLMVWRALADLRAWPAHACIKVDDAPVGMEEGVAAGTWSVGVAASGNGVGLALADWLNLSVSERDARTAAAAGPLWAAGADFVIGSVADLPPVIDEIEARLRRGERPGIARVSTTAR